MGSLTSKPKIPAYTAPQIVYVPQTTVPAVTTPVSAPMPAQNEEEQPSPDTVRAENILRRNRSRLGTILTGFSGLLGSGSAAPQRKTLLGE